MKFVTLEAEKFRKFADHYPDKSFYQTPEIAKLREKSGWTPYYFGVEVNDKLKAATMLVAKPTFIGKSTFYAPGGLLVDYEDNDLLSFFIQNLKKYIKSHNGYVLHLDPYYQLIQRDRDGNVVEGGFNHQQALKNLKNLGFRPIKPPTQPKYLFVLDLKNRTPSELLADFKRNTRNHIKKAEKQGVKVRELNREELDIFKTITESTSKRRHFEDKSLAYYQNMYDLFTPRNEIKFIVAEANQTPLSAAMFMLYGDEVLYLFSGSDEKYMREYNAQYAIQWHMIQYAAKHSFKIYNFYGIQGLPDKSSKDYGIYDFKKGFTSENTGRVIELLGSHELPVNFTFYQIHQLFSKLKSKLAKT